jgi:tetratricopeptide (TPR) repeat protein
VPRGAPRTVSRGGLGTWLPPLALLLLTSLVYAFSFRVPLLDWDDTTYLFRDARLDPLTWENIGRILTRPFFANFHPITTLTFAFDRAVWGSRIEGFHATHLAFYLGGILGLYVLFARVTRSRAAGWFAAAIYAVHTIHVESVAWLASRKDVVCLFFYAFALLAYVGYAESKERRGFRYGLMLLLSAAAMMSKGYAVILPAAYFAYDLCFSDGLTRRNFLDKVPLLLLALGTVLLTVHAQDRDSALIRSTMTGPHRAALLAKIFAVYIGHTLLPVGLSAFYLIAGQPPGSMALLGALLAVGLISLFWLLRRRLPAAAFGIALYLLPLATVMNFFFTLRIWMADRYLFFPTIGSSLALVALVMPLARSRTPTGVRARSRGRARALAAFALLVIGIYSGLTVARIGLWTNRVALWSDVIRNELHLGGSGPVRSADLARITSYQSVPASPIVNLAQAYEAAGNGTEAERISALMGRSGGGGGLESVMTLAREDLTQGRYQQAIERLRPIAGGGTWLGPLATMWTAVAVDRMGDPEGARRTVQRGIDLYRKTGQPATDGLFSVGAMEFNRKNYGRAAEWYGLALRESPRDSKVIYHLGLALQEAGKLPEALAQYRRIPDENLPILQGSQFTIFDVFLQMAIVSERQGRLQDAIRYCEEAIRRAPQDPRRQTVTAAIATLRSRAK